MYSIFNPMEIRYTFQLKVPITSERPSKVHISMIRVVSYVN